MGTPPHDLPQRSPLPDWIQQPVEPYRPPRARIAPPRGGSMAGVLDELREERLS